MVAAGIGANVGLELYVISEGRYRPQDFPEATIDFSKLTWDPYANSSNYAQLATEALAAAGGRGWLTEFAQMVEMDPQYGSVFRGRYLSACVPKMSFTTVPCAPAFDASAGDAGDASNDDAGGDDAGGTGPGTSDAGSCGTSLSSSCDDVDVAIQGMYASDVWVTRLRAFFPASALGAGDLRLTAANQVAETNLHVAASYTDPKYSPCGNGASGSSGNGCACETTPDSADHFGWGCVAGAAVLMLGSRVRRRVRVR
jgi:hypothetical protein